MIRLHDIYFVGTFIAISNINFECAMFAAIVFGACYLFQLYHARKEIIDRLNSFK